MGRVFSNIKRSYEIALQKIVVMTRRAFVYNRLTAW